MSWTYDSELDEFVYTYGGDEENNDEETYDDNEVYDWKYDSFLKYAGLDVGDFE